MSLTTFGKGALIVVVLAGVAAVLSPAEAALDLGSLRERLAERRAEREARLADLQDRLGASRGSASSEQNESGQPEDSESSSLEPQCGCRARFSYARPSMHFGSGGLVFIPRVNVRVSGDGEAGAPPLNVAIAFEGDTNYLSEDVSVPDGIAFSGSHTVLDNVSCEGDFDYDFGGRELGRFVLPGFSSEMVGEHEEIDGVVRMKTALTGCEEESEHRRFEFEVDERGLDVWGWRRVR